MYPPRPPNQAGPRSRGDVPPPLKKSGWTKIAGRRAISPRLLCFLLPDLKIFKLCMGHTAVCDRDLSQNGLERDFLSREKCVTPLNSFLTPSVTSDL